MNVNNKVTAGATSEVVFMRVDKNMMTEKLQRKDI